MKLKILSYNIHKGLSLSNKKFVLEGIRLALREIDPDILFLQEVLGDHKNNKLTIPDWKTQFEYLAESHWPHHQYGKNSIYDEGHHGNAILSKYPIIEWENHIVSHNRKEPRGYMQARISLPEGHKEITVANTHLDLTQRGRTLQVTEIIKHLKKINSPWLMVGDLNDWNRKISPRIERELGAIEVFKKIEGKYPRTFPSPFPILSLDRIFIHDIEPLKVKALKGEIWRKLSDHIPLYAELNV